MVVVDVLEVWWRAGCGCWWCRNVGGCGLTAAGWGPTAATSRRARRSFSRETRRGRHDGSLRRGDVLGGEKRGVARQDVVRRRSSELQDLVEDVQVALPQKGGPLQLDLGKDAAHAPDVDLGGVLGRSEQQLGHAVVDGHDIPGGLALVW